MTRAQEYQRIREKIVELLEEFPGSDIDNAPLEEVISQKVDGFLSQWDPDGGYCKSFIFFQALIEHPCTVRKIFYYFQNSKAC